MGALRQDGPDRYVVAFAELARLKRGQVLQLDPFLIAQAIALVMRECNVRSALGKPLVWNDYRLILARTEFERIRPLQVVLERDLKTVLAQEATARKAELVGELRVTVVFDEANELREGEGVVRVAFVPTERLAAPRAGELTMRLDSWAVAGEIDVRAPAGTDTVAVADSTGPGPRLRWPGGETVLPFGLTFVVGRDHVERPASFVALTGAGGKVSKQHFWIAAGSERVRVGRFAKANPVHVNGELLAPGAEIDASLPCEISLSRGDLVVTVSSR